MTAIGSAGAIRTAVAGLSVAAAVLLTGFVGVSPAAADDPPAGITLEVKAVNGSGCAPGSASVRMSPDDTSFRITYNDFTAKDGGAAKPTEFRRACVVSVQVHVPQGFTYAVASADYRGFARMGSGSSALQHNNYWFQGVGQQNNTTDHMIYGALNGSWHTRDVTDVTALEYNPCGRDTILNISTELRIDSPNNASQISLTTSSADVNTLVQFSWKSC